MAETHTLTLTDFLLARIAETEKANALIADWQCAFDKPAVTVCLPNGSRLWTADMLRLDCEAKRRIVELFARGEQYGVVLRLIALPYADHPDYREEWKP